MSHNIKFPNPLRIFAPVSPETFLLRRTGEVLSAGEVVQAKGFTLMSYDHRDQLALSVMFSGNERYVLLEEISEPIRAAVNQWVSFHQESIVGEDERAREKAVAGRDRQTPVVGLLLERYVVQ